MCFSLVNIIGKYLFLFFCRVPFFLFFILNIYFPFLKFPFFLLLHGRSAQPVLGPVHLTIPHPPSLEEGIVAQKHLLAHGTISWCSVHATPASPAVQDLALEQAFLEECLLVHTSLVRPFMKKMGAGMFL